MNSPHLSPAERLAFEAAFDELYVMAAPTEPLGKCFENFFAAGRDYERIRIIQVCSDNIPRGVSIDQMRIIIEAIEQGRP